MHAQYQMGACLVDLFLRTIEATKDLATKWNFPDELKELKPAILRPFYSYHISTCAEYLSLVDVIIRNLAYLWLYGQSQIGVTKEGIEKTGLFEQNPVLNALIEQFKKSMTPAT